MKRRLFEGESFCTVTTQVRAGTDSASAWSLAMGAARSAGVDVLTGLDDRAISEVQTVVRDVWATPAGHSMLPGEMLHAFQHSGNYVAVARHRGTLVGVAVGFVGFDIGGLHLHSHMTGVVPGRQVRNVGYAIKLHQRAWCLDRGLTRVTWTFDPMIRRNAYFNLSKLGAGVESFHENLYGQMVDGLNAEDVSDRFVAGWDLRDSVPRLDARSSQAGDSTRQRLAVGAELQPVLGQESSASDEGSGGVEWFDVPSDFATLRRRDVGLAREWRRAFRATLGHRMAEGWSVAEFSRTMGYGLKPNAIPANDLATERS